MTTTMDARLPKTERVTNAQIVKVNELLPCLERIIALAEKKRSRQSGAHRSHRQGNSSRFETKHQDRLCASVHRSLQTSPRGRGHKVDLQRGELRSDEPIRSTEFLHRNTQKQMEVKLPKKNHIIMRETRTSAEPRRQSNSSSTVSNSTLGEKRSRLPCFKYQHGDAGKENKRNIPGNLAWSNQLRSSGSIGEKNPIVSDDSAVNRRSNDHLERCRRVMHSTSHSTSSSRHDDTVDTSLPLDPAKKQYGVTEAMIVCKHCRRPPGNHQDTCVYKYFQNKDDTVLFDMIQSSSLADDEPPLSVPEKFSDIGNTRRPISISASQTVHKEADRTRKMARTELPDYSSIHRDVYIRALADSRTRLVLEHPRGFTNQTTESWIFSYFSRLGNGKTKRRVSNCGVGANGMAIIFGKKGTDFTEYYRLFARNRPSVVKL